MCPPWRRDAGALRDNVAAQAVGSLKLCPRPDKRCIIVAISDAPRHTVEHGNFRLRARLNGASGN